MSYRIRLRREALRELKGLPGYVRAEALDKIDALAMDPRPPRAKELRGVPGVFRLWIAAHWRLVYQVKDDEALIWVLRIRRKEAIDYESLGSEVHEPAGAEYSAQLQVRMSFSSRLQELFPENVQVELPFEIGEEIRVVVTDGAIVLMRP